MKTIFFTWLYSPDEHIALKNSIYNKADVLEKYYIDGRVNTPFKRSIIVDDRKALNYLVQSTTADLVLDKAVEIDKFLQDKKSFVSHIVHDEIVLDMADDERELIVDIKKMFAENILGNYLVNLKAGKNYLDLEDLKL
jgi:DNA polymerase I-like protein with 3'-5' exonuclease and polymerase domains